MAKWHLALGLIAPFFARKLPVAVCCLLYTGYIYMYNTLCVGQCVNVVQQHLLCANNHIMKVLLNNVVLQARCLLLGALDFYFWCIVSVVKNKESTKLCCFLRLAMPICGGGITVLGKLNYESSVRRNECKQIFHIFM